MKYTINKESLLLREYGRNTQNLIFHLREIEDRTKRQQVLEQIIAMIMRMYPSPMNEEDYKVKIWMRILQLLDYDIDVDLPENLPKEEPQVERVRLEYPSINRKDRHYGKNIQVLIEKVLIEEDVDKQKELVKMIANYMRKALRSFNKEGNSDEMVWMDLKRMTKGKLAFLEEMTIEKLLRSKKGGQRNYRHSSNRKQTDKNQFGRKGRTNYRSSGRKK